MQRHQNQAEDASGTSLLGPKHKPACWVSCPAGHTGRDARGFAGTPGHSSVTSLSPMSLNQPLSSLSRVMQGNLHCQTQTPGLNSKQQDRPCWKGPGVQ